MEMELILYLRQYFFNVQLCFVNDIDINYISLIHFRFIFPLKFRILKSQGCQKWYFKSLI